jgi:hypothetical protein
MINKFLIAAVAAGAFFGSVGAHATTITTATQTVTFGPGLTDFTNASQNLNLFDSSLGTLASVVISGSFGFNSTVTVSNNAEGVSTGTVKTESAAAFGSSVTSINAIFQALLDTNGLANIGGTILRA